MALLTNLLAGPHDSPQSMRATIDSQHNERTSRPDISEHGTPLAATASSAPHSKSLTCQSRDSSGPLILKELQSCKDHFLAMYPELGAAGQALQHLCFQRLLVTAVTWILCQSLTQQSFLKLLQLHLLVLSLHGAAVFSGKSKKKHSKATRLPGWQQITPCMVNSA